MGIVGYPVDESEGSEELRVALLEATGRDIRVRSRGADSVRFVGGAIDPREHAQVAVGDTHEGYLVTVGGVAWQKRESSWGASVMPW
jgi:hypothetical protein